MENKKDNKKLVIIIVILLLLIGVGVALYFFLTRETTPASISISNGTSYPSFSEETSNYTIYTSETSLNFVCTGSSVTGCDTPVPVSNSSSSHTIVINNKTYTFSITKVVPNSTTLAIRSIRGNPTAWTNDATLTVTVENSGTVKELEYTFDGGETWQTSNSARITKNGTYKVQARDYFGFLSDVQSVKVTKVDTVAPTLEISREITGESEAVLTAIAADTASGIDSYSWNNGATTPTITVTTSGTYAVSVTDVAGNVARKSVVVRFTTDEEVGTLPDTSSSSSSSSSGSSSTRQPTDNIQRGGDEDITVIVRPPSPTNPTNPDPTPSTYTYVALFVGNGASSETSRSCTTTSTCAIRTPSIYRSGYEIIGWSTHADSHTAEFAPNEQITLSGNITLYAITKRTLTASFAVQDSIHASTTTTSSSCSIYNEEYSCPIMTAPLLVASGYTALGWNLTPSSTTASIAQNTTYNLVGDTIFYSITRRDTPIHAVFTIPDPDSATMNGGTTECLLYNAATECQLVAPNLVANENYTALGWHNPNDEEQISLESGETFYLGADEDGKTFYAVVRSDLYLSATFILQDPAAGTLSRSTVSCLPEAGGQSCSVNVPTVELNSGYALLGWSRTAASTTAELSATTILLTENITYYSVTKKTTPLSATFVVQDSSAATLSGESTLTCELYNGASSCEIVAPSLTANSGYEALGWNTTSSSTSASVPFGTSAEISSDTTFYSITRDSSPISATFRLQDSTISSMDGGTTSCLRYNGATTCEIVAPTLRGSNGHAPLGWALSSEAEEATVASGGTTSISGGEIFYAITKKTIVVTFHNGTETTTHTCVLYRGTKECTFVFPTIDSSDFLGWSWIMNADEPEFYGGESATVYENTEYYSVSRVVIHILFQVQDYNAVTSTSVDVQCNLYNGATYCSGTVPELTAASGYTALGWNTDPTATTASLTPGASFNFSREETYYSITRRTAPVRATFTIPSSTSSFMSQSGGTTQCFLYNGASTCQLVSPTLTSSDSNNYAAGWGLSENGPVTLGAGIPFQLGEDTTYYSISQNNIVVYFSKNTTFQSGTTEIAYGNWTNNNLAATALSFEGSTNCVSYNLNTCKLASVPRIYSPGHMVLGYGVNPGGDVYLVYSLNITGSGTLYARIWDWYSLSNFVLGETKKISVDDSNENAYYPVEFQDTIESSVRTDYTEYIERAFNNVPALKTLYGKMRFSNYTTYNAYPSHDGSAGVTYPYFGIFAPIDILSPYDDAADGYIKHAIIHELGHALDGAFYERTGTFLHDYSEFTTARSELLAIRNAQDDSTADADRPLSEYAFSDDEGFEFLAEAFIAYYRDRYGAYYSTTLGYTTDSLNSAFEKYLCYAENDYNMESDCE